MYVFKRPLPSAPSHYLVTVKDSKDVEEVNGGVREKDVCDAVPAMPPV